jgi:hypothetical protein
MPETAFAGRAHRVGHVTLGQELCKRKSIARNHSRRTKAIAHYRWTVVLVYKAAASARGVFFVKYSLMAPVVIVHSAKFWVLCRVSGPWSTSLC